MVIFVLQVYFIYKTFLEKSQAGTEGLEPPIVILEGCCIIHYAMCP